MFQIDLWYQHAELESFARYMSSDGPSKNGSGPSKHGDGPSKKGGGNTPFLVSFQSE